MTDTTLTNAAHAFAYDWTKAEAIEWAKGWSNGDAELTEQLATKAFNASCDMANDKSNASDELVTFFAALARVSEAKARAKSEGAEADTQDDDYLAWSAWVIVEQQQDAANAGH